MSSSNSLKSTPLKAKRSLNLASESPVSKTPEKHAGQLHRRSRNRGAPLSVKEIRQVAQTRLKHPKEHVKSARRQILSAELLLPPPPITSGDRSGKLPEKYEILCEFFDSLDSVIRLLRLKNSMPTFTNISPKIECLTDRRFSYGHLAQLKHILPEGIEIKRMLSFDEKIGCMKPDLHISIVPDAIECGDKFKYGSYNLNLRKVFRARLADFLKAHSEVVEIPKDDLPEPFNQSKLTLQLNLINEPRSSSTALMEKQSLIAQGEIIQEEEPARTSVSNLKLRPAMADSIKSTPAKLSSTPPRFMTATPTPQPEKRCYMSPYEDSSHSSSKLVRRPPCPRSLKFDTPLKEKKVVDEVHEAADKLVDDEDDCLSILPERLLHSIRQKEKLTMEEQDPAISQAKRRQRMVARLPKLFNMIHYLFQSLRRSVITKEELMHKIIAGHCDIADRGEVEEQLNLLLELAPEWISENLASAGDLLICINKVSSPESIQMRIQEAK